MQISEDIFKKKTADWWHNLPGNFNPTTKADNKNKTTIKATLTLLAITAFLSLSSGRVSSVGHDEWQSTHEHGAEFWAKSEIFVKNYKIQGNFQVIRNYRIKFIAFFGFRSECTFWIVIFIFYLEWNIIIVFSIPHRIKLENEKDKIKFLIPEHFFKCRPII